MPRWFTSLIVATLLSIPLIHYFSHRRAVKPGIVAEPPKQINIRDGKRWAHQGLHFTPLADFEMRARVVHRERYFSGIDGALSPVDLAVAWGEISDPAVYPKLRFRQYDRWYRWKNIDGIYEKDVIAQTANMHIIPSTPDTRRAVLEARTGDIIHLQGKLVQISGADDFSWASSMSREDTGAYSCELVWVDSFAIE